MKLEQVIQKILSPLRSAPERYLFLRYDGGIIFDSKNNDDSLTLGVLIAGTWQASAEMKTRLNIKYNEEEFRLSFDTSSDGIHVLKVSQKKKEYYLVCIYKNCVTSGLLKRKLSVLKSKIENDLHQGPDEELKPLRHEFLFERITDDEMNRLFFGVGI